MENNKNKKSVKFQGDMLNFCDFIQVFVFTRNHHLKLSKFAFSAVGLLVGSLPITVSRAFLCSPCRELVQTSANTMRLFAGINP